MLFNLYFIAAICMDLMFGDPRSFPHPVRYIGWLCIRFEEITRKVFRSPSIAGLFSFFLVFLCTVLPLFFLLAFLHQLEPAVEIVIAVIILYSSIACRDLCSHSVSVYNTLQDDKDVESARTEIAKIVGRDTSNLDSHSICRACVETVAENLVDGVTAPVFFAIIVSCIPHGDILSPISLAVLGAYGYKAINTMDSMYGYKNEQYSDFGRIAAKVDDLVNILPARISGLFLVFSAPLLRLDTRNAWTIFFRDRLNHSSPNAGHPEAAVAGALGVQLGGPSVYFGKTIHKPTIGDPLRPLDPEDIKHTNRLMFTSALLFLTFFLVLRTLITG